MTLKRRLAMILAVVLLAVLLYGMGRLGMTVEEQKKEEDTQEEFLFGHRDTLYLWYTDEALTDFLNSAAVSYGQYQDDVRVVPVYTPGLEYLETINQASLKTEEVPDLYIVSNDSLEKAYLAGLATGMWSSLEDIWQNWTLGRLYQPAMEAEERARLLSGWHAAVDRVRSR